MVTQAIRPHLERMHRPAEPSVAEHVFLLAHGYKKPDGTVDQKAFTEAMDKNEWLKGRTTPEEAKAHIETACALVERGTPEGASWVLSLKF